MQEQTPQPVPKERHTETKNKPRRTVRLGTTVLTVVLVAAIAFVGGTRSDAFLAWIHNSQNPNLPQTLDLSSVEDVYAKLRSQFDGSLDQQKLIDGAKKGLVAAAGDPYTVYFTDSEAQQFNDDLDGKFSGIGAEIASKNNSLIISSTIDESPAQKAGLLANDVLAKVNGQDTTGWSIDKAVAQIRGQKGTTVKLTIVRGQDVKDFSIVRDDIVSPSVTWQELDGNIGYMRISRFADDTADLAQKAAAEFVSKNVVGVILDVRGNGGGYLTAAQSVAGLWLPAGQEVVQERTGTKVQDTLQAEGSAPLKGIPSVVLIDGGSASASEIVSGALHDHKAAQLVGTKTFGKGSVQQLVDVPAGGKLKVTIAKWYTPNGKNINKEGITPDVTVTPSDADIASNNDIQKAKAIELLKK